MCISLAQLRLEPADEMSILVGVGGGGEHKNLSGITIWSWKGFNRKISNPDPAVKLIVTLLSGFWPLTISQAQILGLENG